MSRFYVKAEGVKGGKIYVGGSEAHHILDVMRLKEGDSITAFDGTGVEYHGKIEKVLKRSLIIAIEKEYKQKEAAGPNITLAQAVPRGPRMDYVIQKASELGINSLIPMNTKRTVVKLKGGKARPKLERWKRIAAEASKQCGRSDITRIEEYMDFTEVLNKAGEYGLILMPIVSCGEKNSLKKILPGFDGRAIMVLIGPEGGFAPEELGLASKLKPRLNFVTLGRNTLRSDTAAIAVIAMIKFATGGI